MSRSIQQTVHELLDIIAILEWPQFSVSETFTAKALMVLSTCIFRAQVFCLYRRLAFPFRTHCFLMFCHLTKFFVRQLVFVGHSEGIVRVVCRLGFSHEGLFLEYFWVI